MRIFKNLIINKKILLSKFNIVGKINFNQEKFLLMKNC